MGFVVKTLEVDSTADNFDASSAWGGNFCETCRMLTCHGDGSGMFPSNTVLFEARSLTRRSGASGCSRKAWTPLEMTRYDSFLSVM